MWEDIYPYKLFNILEQVQLNKLEWHYGIRSAD